MAFYFLLQVLLLLLQPHPHYLPTILYNALFCLLSILTNLLFIRLTEKNNILLSLNNMFETKEL